MRKAIGESTMICRCNWEQEQNILPQLINGILLQDLLWVIVYPKIGPVRLHTECSSKILKVNILTKVKITNIATKKTVEYQIVGEQEADLKSGKISVTSPIGKGLLGKTIGEIAEVQTPNGIIKFKIEEINI